MLVYAFVMFLMSLQDIIEKVGDGYLASTEYWVVALFEMFGILSAWLVFINTMLYFLAGVIDVGVKTLTDLTRFDPTIGGEDLRAYARQLLKKDTIKMTVAQQRWSRSMFFGAILTVLLAFVFIWLQALARGILR